MSHNKKNKAVIIQAVLRCKKCNKFLNLFSEDIAECKCQGAISKDPIYFEFYENDENYENFFLRDTDSIEKKKSMIVGKFVNTKRNKYYLSLLISEDTFQITHRCSLDSSTLPGEEVFSHVELSTIKGLILKERNSAKYTIGDVIGEDMLIKLKKNTSYPLERLKKNNLKHNLDV